MTPTQRWTMVAAILGSAIVFLDGTLVNVALARIGEDLPASRVSVLEGQTYVLSGYLATLAALLIPAGALADLYGRRRIFGLGLAGFGVASVLCGLAPTLEALVLFRLLQGATGALLIPGSLALINAAMEGDDRGRAFGVWASVTSATALLGPLVGGFLVDAVSWRAAFLINVPLVLLGLWATRRHVRESRDEEAKGPVDWLGATVVVLAVGGLAFGAIRGQERQWEDLTAFVALAVGAVAFVAFPFLMAHRPNPLVPLKLFRVREFAVINLSTLLIYGALYATFGFQGLFLQGAIGYTALAAGLVGLPSTLLLTFFSTRAGEWASRIGARPFLTVGPVLMALGLGWFARLPADTQPWLAQVGAPQTLFPPRSVWIDLFPGTVLFGLGLTLLVAPLTAALMASVSEAHAGVASAINNAISRVGQPLLAAVIFVVVTGGFYQSLGERVPGLDPHSAQLRRAAPPLNRPDPKLPEEVKAAAREASTETFHLAVLVGAGLLLAGAAINLIGLRKQATRRAPGHRFPR